ncbi:hypothetical protein [Mariniphaga sp.]|uniref:hypothetical protein n=1 Tax=Mariniphaga sp. TaxID=1954475 RepID=UPI0035657547
MAQRKKIQKITGWFALAFLLLLLGSIIVLWVKFIPDYVKNYLSEFTDEKSEGIYSLSIDAVKIKLLPFSVKFEHVNLLPDEELAVLNKNNQNKTFYTFSASEIELEEIKLKALLNHRKFICNQVLIKNPSIKLEGEDLLKSDSTKINSTLVSDIRPLFEMLDEVKINRIVLEEANFGFYGALGNTDFISQAKKVSVDVLGFTTNTEMIQRNTGFFKTDDVLIRMNDFQNDMGDSLHVLTIDTLLYSLKSTDIRAAGFRLFPQTRNAEKNLFDVTVPNLTVKSRSIARFALDDSLKIRYLEFNKPDISFYRKENPQQFKLEAIDNFDLYELVQNNFSKLEVDSFFLHDAKVEIFRQPDFNNYQQQFRAVDIILNRFELDSVSARNREKLLHADDLEMTVAGYHLRLDDNEHEFKADSLFVSTFTDRLGAKKIHLQPLNKNQSASRTEVNVECESLNIEGIVLRNLYHTKTLPSEKIEVIGPKVHLLYHLEKAKPAKQAEGGLLFELVTDYLQGVYSNLVYIERGRLDIENNLHGNLQGYFETSFNFSLTDFSLDSASVEQTDKFFYATNFDLNFSNYTMRLVDDLHKLEVDNVLISSINQQIQINNLELQPVIENVSVDDMKRFNRSELFHVTVPGIKLTGVDLRNAFFNNKLLISNFSISNPDIYFENFGALRSGEPNLELTELYQLIFNYIEDFDIRKFIVSDGNLNWVNHTRRGKTTSFDNAFSASLQNFRLNETELPKKRLLFSDNFEVSIRDQQFELSDSVHVLKGSEIRLSSATSSVQVKNGLLFPLITSKKYHDLATTFQVAIPEINIEGFDFQNAWYSQEPFIDKLELVSPRFQIYTQKGKTKSLDLKTYTFPMPAFIESLKLNEFKITDGEAVTYQTSETSQKAQANFKLNFSMPGIMLKNNNNQIQLQNQNIQLEISDFRAPIDELHNILIGQIDFDRERKSVSVSGLKVEPFLRREDQNLFKILAPEIHFTGFDLETAFEQNSFEFGQIEINNPDISIEINRKIKDDTLEFLQTLDLYPYVEHLINQVKIDNLNLNKAYLHFNWLEKQLFQNELHISFKDIFLSENQPPANLLNSREFNISTTNLSTTNKNGMYEFTADSLIYNSARHNVWLKNIQVNPLAKKEEFPRKTGFQTDVAKASIEYIEFQKINEKRWLQDNILAAEKLQIGPASLEIFRDKRFPFNHSQRPPWPQDHLKNISQDFVFDSVKLMPSYIKYSDLLSISDEPGVIEFYDLTFSGGRLSNSEKETGQNNIFELNAQAKLLNQSLLKANFRFDLTSPDYVHSVTGFLQPMPLEPLNSMISKSAPLAIETGYLNRLDFDINFYQNQATGNLYFAYDNLKIAVLDYSSDEIQKAKFASFLANNLVVNSKNPKGNELVPVKISYVRDEERSILNFWWKSIYSGAKKVIGLNP